jgi:ABC-type antimicrobial peptide transport system ATPase subunit
MAKETRMTIAITGGNGLQNSALALYLGETIVNELGNVVVVHHKSDYGSSITRAGHASDIARSMQATYRAQAKRRLADVKLLIRTKGE